jgi:hypothetical protein
MSASDHKHNDALERVLGPTGFEVTCEQCFELLDQYVELEVAGANADEHLPGLRTHLEGCPACREDHDSLYALIVADDAAASR